MLAAVLDEGKVWSFQNMFLMLERPLPGNSYSDWLALAFFVLTNGKNDFLPTFLNVGSNALPLHMSTSGGHPLPHDFLDMYSHTHNNAINKFACKY